MNKVDRRALIELVENEKTTNLSIVAYLSAIAMSKYDEETGYPTISNFTIYKLYKNMQDKMDWINESSVTLAVERLVEQKYFDFIDDNLIITNSGIGHIPSDEYYKSDGYITLHHFFFNRIFFKVSLPAKKIALLAVCRLNGDVLDPEKINFKSNKDPQTFPYYCRILKVNRLAHIRAAIKELKGLFNIVELANNTVQFALNTISKALITGTDKLWNFTQVQLEKTEKILKEVNTKKLNFKHKDIQEITEAIKDNTMEFNRKVLKEFCKNCRRDVKRITGYVKSIVNRLKADSV